MKDLEDPEARALEALIVLAHLGEEAPIPPAAASLSGEEAEGKAADVLRQGPRPGLASASDQEAAAA